LQQILNQDTSEECPLCLGLGADNTGWISSLVYFGLVIGGPISG